MTILTVEELGKDLVIRLTPEAREHLALSAGDEVVLSRNANGEVSLAAPDVDHQLRLERSRAFIRRFRSPFQLAESERPPAAPVSRE